MKHIFLTLTFSVICLMGFAQVKFEILGEITAGNTANNSYIYLRYGDRTNLKIDSALIVNNRFRFKGNTAEGTMATLSKGLNNDRDDSQLAPIYLDKGKIKVSIDYSDFKSIDITGSKAHDDYKRWDNIQQKFLTLTKPMNDSYSLKNQEYMRLMREHEMKGRELELKKDSLTELRNSMEPYFEDMNEEGLKYIQANPNSYTSAYLLRMQLSSLPLAQSESYFQSFSPSVKGSPYGKEVLKELQRIKGGSVGSKANLFSAIDINGDPLNLSDYKGRYVMLDFWASWCVPCRKGNPHLISLYNKYKNQGFEIIGISDDDSNPGAWKKAVEQDQIHIWKHVLRGLKRTSSGYDKSADITDAYGTSTLPTKILIDPNGLIIGRYTGNGEDDAAMDKKLAEIFN